MVQASGADGGGVGGAVSTSFVIVGTSLTSIALEGVRLTVSVGDGVGAGVGARVGTGVGAGVGAGVG